MIEKKIFKSILNNDKLAASELFNTKYNEIDRVLRNSRLKNLFLELINLNDFYAEKFLNLKKLILSGISLLFLKLLEYRKCLKTIILDMSL